MSAPHNPKSTHSPSPKFRKSICLVAILTCLFVLGQIFRSVATINVAAQRESDEQRRTPAPSTPAKPDSVSFVSFADLAARDAQTSKDLKLPAATVNEIRAMREIEEPDSGAAPIRDVPPTRSDIGDPFIVSPAPSQNFPAQEDANLVGTGISVIPPDTMGAVGLDKLLVTLNNNYRVQDKATGAALSTVSINTFWSSLGASNVSQSRVQYDPYNNRWLIAALADGGTAGSAIFVGISANADPQGAFALFRFAGGCTPGSANCNASGELADFPMMGFNKNWVAISWNQFLLSNGSFLAGKMLVLDYPALRSGAVNSTMFTVATATNPANFSMHPATTLSPGEETLYVPAHQSSAGAIYRLHLITGTPAAPVYMLDGTSRTRPGGAWTQPAGEILPQACVGTGGVTCPNSVRFIDSGDAFLRSNVVFRNSSIWYSQTIALPAGGLFQAGTHTAVQWTRLDTGGGFIEGGRVEDPAATATFGDWYAYSSIAVNANNDVLLGFSTFGRTHFVGASYALRLGTDPSSTMRAPVVFKQGEDYYSKDFGGTRNRWGNYSHSVIDPSNDQDFWTIQEYAGTRVIQDSQTTSNTSRWGTWWAKVPPNGPPPSPTPTISPTPPGCPATLTINSNGDGNDAGPGDRVCATAAGECTLRAAIQEANALSACGVIDIGFSGVASPIVLGIRLPDINHSINLNGPGANQLTVQRTAAPGAPSFRILTILSNRTVSITGLTVSNGNATSFPTDGGGILNGGALTITNSVISGNMSGRGGGIYTNGTLTILHSTISGNSAISTGGGIEGLQMRIINSTISGNTAAGSGGGVRAFNASTTITNVTISGNRANSDNSGGETGGGIDLLGGGATLSNTIVAGNFSGSGTTASDISNSFTNIGASSFNLIGTGGSGGLTNGVNNNQVGVSNPQMGALGNYGGGTMTHALLAGSPALNAGSNALAVDQNSNALTIDQRALTRIVGASVDVGSFELQSGEVPSPSPTPTPTPTPTPIPSPPPCLAFTVNSSGDASDSLPGDAVCATVGGACTLRAAIEEANALSCGTININFSNVTSPISLGAGLPTIFHNLNINGPGANQLTVQRSTAGGTPEFRIFSIYSGPTVAISGMTISNGKMTGDCSANDGAGINNGGTLTLTDVNLFANNARCARGAGIFSNGPSLTLNNSKVEANSTSGGIFSGGTFTMNGGSVSGNVGGGLVLTNGPNTLNGVLISSNGSNLDGGGAELWSGATFINCLIANNAAPRNGGGIHGAALLINSTVSGNQSGGSGGGIEQTGSRLVNSTITNNRSNLDDNGNEPGGGIHVQSGIVFLHNSIIAGNFRGSGTTADDISGTVNSSSSFNLIGTGGAGGLTNGTNSNQVGVSNPLLGPLATNGGPTMTHALLSGSPAINSGSNSLALDQNSVPLITDQRGPGFVRVANSTVDIGAFESGQVPGTVQLGESSYAISEGSAFATITVQRNGDTSTPATVKYATSDATDVNFVCNPSTAGQITGAASRKCDYHIAAGRLRFAAGETAKQIILSIVNDVYVEGPETLTIGLSSPTGATLGSTSSASVTITDNDTPGQANPIDNTGFYVRMLYVDLLSREPDTAGFNGWVHRIDFCGQPGEPPPPCDRVTVGGDGFLRSAEFFDREFFVIRLYRTALGRILRYDDVGDLAYVSGFLTDADLELNKQDLVNEIMGRPEFSNMYNGLSNAQYVDTMISTAAVTLPAGVRDGWVNALDGATKTRAQVFRELSERAEVSAKYLHEAQVISCYYGFFTRNPDGAYFTFLQRYDNGEITLGDLANAFINAAEYRQRFGP